MKQGVLTLALGKDYVRLASNLAYSFLCFNSTRHIGFTIVSNEAIKLDQKLIEQGVSVITSNKFSYNNDQVLLNKLLVPQLSPFDYTIMLDADCMIAGSLAPLFRILEKSDFAVVGEAISKGNWHGNVYQILQTFNIPAIYRFVGSFYFFSQNEAVKNLCAKALEICVSHHGPVIDRIHHNFVNEEVPLSIALAMFEKEICLRVLPETAPIKAETMFYPVRNINLLTGNSCMSVPATNFGTETLEGYWPACKTPLIVVFDSNSRRHFDYKLNATLVRLYMPTRVRERSVSSIAKTNYAFRIVAAIGLSLFTDLYNKYKSLKQFVKRILH